MTHRITAPVAGFTGTVAGLGFADGVAEGAPSAGALGYFRRRGYTVEAVGGDESQGAEKMPARSASKGDWVAYAVAHGMTAEDADAATRDELAARFHGPREDG